MGSTFSIDRTDPTPMVHDKKLRAFIFVLSISAFPDQRRRSKPFQPDCCTVTLDCFAFERNIPPSTSPSFALRFMQIVVGPTYRVNHIHSTDHSQTQETPHSRGDAPRPHACRDAPASPTCRPVLYIGWIRRTQSVYSSVATQRGRRSGRLYIATRTQAVSGYG